MKKTLILIVLFFGANSLLANPAYFQNNKSILNATAQQESRGWFGPTVVCDNLWQIAYRARPNKFVTLQQVMVVLLSKNPDAFYKNNIYGLKRGVFLRLPVLDEIKKVFVKDAEVMVKQDKLKWKQIEAANDFPEDVAQLKNQKCVPGNVKNMLKRFQFKTVKPKTAIAVQTENISQTIMDDKQNTLTQEQADPQQEIKQLTEKTIILQSTINRLLAEKKSIYMVLMMQEREITKLNRQLERDIYKIQFRQTARQTKAVSHGLLLEPGAKYTFGSQVLRQLVNTSEMKNVSLKKYLAHYPVMFKHMLSIPSLQLVLLCIITIVSILLLILLWIVTRDYLGYKKTNIDSSSLARNTGIKEKPSNYSYLAGEDPTMTQLDLARAYIDMGDYKSAQNILKKVAKHGNESEHKKALKLMQEIINDKQDEVQ